MNINLIKKMFRYVAFLPLALMAFGLAACKQGDDDNEALVKNLIASSLVYSNNAAQVKNLTASPLVYSVDLSWDIENSENAASFNIYDEKTNRLIQSTSKKNTTITNLLGDTNYEFSVVPVSKSGEVSSKKSKISFNTYPEGTYTDTVSDVLYSIELDSSNKNVLRISWTNPLTNWESVKIFKSGSIESSNIVGYVTSATTPNNQIDIPLSSVFPDKFKLGDSVELELKVIGFPALLSYKDSPVSSDDLLVEDSRGISYENQNMEGKDKDISVSETAVESVRVVKITCVNTTTQNVMAVKPALSVENRIGYDSITFTYNVLVDPYSESFSDYEFSHIKVEQKNNDSTEGDVWTSIENTPVGQMSGTYTVKNLSPGNTYTIRFIACYYSEDTDDYKEKVPIVKTLNIPSAVKHYDDGYVGKGYNVIESAFYNPADVKLTLVDTRMLAQRSVPTRTEIKSFAATTSAGKTISEYIANSKFNVDVGVKKGLLFKKSFSAGFGLEKESKKSISSETSFASISSIRRGVKITYNNTIDEIKESLVDSFKKDLNDNSVTPEQLFTTYGTHILLDTIIGARYDLSFRYKNTQGDETEKIKKKVNASYGVISSSTSTSTDTTVKNFCESSTMTIDAFGGKAPAGTNLQSATEGYNKWVASLDDNDYVLVDSDILDTMANKTPIWLYADDAARRNAIKEKFEELAVNSLLYMSDLQDLSEYYICGLGIYTSSSTVTDIETIREYAQRIYGDKRIVVVGEKSVANGNVDINQFDLRKGLGTKAGYCYLWYALSNDVNEALKGISVAYCKYSSQVKRYLYDEEAFLVCHMAFADSATKRRENKWKMAKPDGAHFRDRGGDVLTTSAFWTSPLQDFKGATGADAKPIKDIRIVFDNTYISTLRKPLSGEKWEKWYSCGPNETPGTFKNINIGTGCSNASYITMEFLVDE